MNKIQYYPHLLPDSVAQTICRDSPSTDTNTDYSSDWYSKYSSIPYNNTIFFKGPLLFNEVMTDNTVLNNTNINTFKSKLKTYILGVQSSGNAVEWSPQNFKLNSIAGLRNSARIKLQSPVDYTN